MELDERIQNENDMNLQVGSVKDKQVQDLEKRVKGLEGQIKLLTKRVAQLEKFQNKVEEPVFSADLCEEITCKNCGGCEYMEERI